MRFKINAGKLRRDLKKKTIKYGEKVIKIMDTMGQAVAASIKQRVQDKGVGLKGQMKAYSSSYKAYKSSTGRDAGKRDLTFTGNMWAGLTTERTRNRIRIFFIGSEQKKASFNQELDEFFGITDSEQKVVDKAAKKFKEVKV